MSYLFRELKEQGLQIKENTKIVFGSNVGLVKSMNKYLFTVCCTRGLMAAGTWVEVWPENEKQVVAVSSIYEASFKVLE